MLSAIERDLGRIAADADVGSLGPMLIGTAYLQFAGQRDTPDADAVRRAMITATGGARPSER